MTQLMTKISSELDQLSANLLSTLDDSIFFSELSKFLSSHLKVDKILINKVLEDESVKLVVKNKRALKNGATLKKGTGAAGHVIRTKQAYFSNSVQRDPLFEGAREEGIKSELCVPVSHEGIVIATIHLQSKEREFSRDDITDVLSILRSLEKPISNLKLYISALNLNEALKRKIEVQEKELQEREKGVKLADSFRISEKEIVGKSDTMKELLEVTDKLANSEVNAIIRGETGTGRDMIARRVHCRSNRKDKAFIVLDCASFTEENLEIEIFGREHIEFSKNHEIQKGVLEAADGGTLLLKHINTLGPSLQMRLLNFITEGSAFRVGSQIPFRSNVRILTTTSTDIVEEVENGKFSQELLYCLSIMTLNVPALRDRKKDIEIIASFFLNADKNVEEQKSFSPGAIKALTDYHWPGNVRELMNIVERACILADGKIVEKCHLADCVTESVQETVEQEESATCFAEMTLNELEQKHICMTLEHLGGNKTRTAKALGITVKTLYNKLHSYGMIDLKEA